MFKLFIRFCRPCACLGQYSFLSSGAKDENKMGDHASGIGVVLNLSKCDNLVMRKNKWLNWSYFLFFKWQFDLLLTLLDFRWNSIVLQVRNSKLLHSLVDFSLIKEEALN